MIHLLIIIEKFRLRYLKQIFIFLVGGGGGIGGGIGFAAGIGGAGGIGLGGGGAGGGATLIETTVEKHHIIEKPTVIAEKVIDVEVHQPPPAASKKIVIEKTVIPNYVEKTVRVPTYVEKTIRVPTYVEKKIKVPAAPTIVEKTISQEEVPVEHHEITVKHKHAKTITVPESETILVKEHHHHIPHKTVVYHKYVW